MPDATKEKPSKDATATRRRNALGPIRADECYPLEVFKQRTGLDTWAMRQARRAGLKVKQVGRCRFVRGSDFLDFLDLMS